MADHNLPQLKEQKIVKKLGEGGFGAVYLTEDVRTGEKNAMKVESRMEEIQALKMEVVVLEKAAAEGGSHHFCKIFDKGRNESFNYVIMTLVGQSLQDLRKACPAQKFSTGTALRVGIQCLEAIEYLHKIGYLHRDVKPGNFAIGREELKEQRIVYILDFGLARKYVKEGGVVRRPRASLGFRGTLLYASLNSHNDRELSRKDDLETWFYQQIEISKGSLPWGKMRKEGRVAERKVQSRRTGEMTQDAPRQYGPILTHIDSLKYYDTPDYQMVYGLLREAMQERGCRDADPYDWELIRDRGGRHIHPAPTLLPLPL